MSGAKKHSGLGRGLDALLGDAPALREEQSAPRPRASLPIEFLAPNPDQPRRVFAEDSLEELAQSIRARGLLQPILVRPRGADRFEIVAGERRWRAAQRAGLHDVPVVIRELADEAASEIALIENVQRVDLSPVEEARAYQRLSEVYKRSQDEIAKAVGKSRSHVANLMRLLALPAYTLERLEAGEITMGHARAMLPAANPDRVCKNVIEGGLSVRATEKLVATMLRVIEEKKAARTDGASSSVHGSPPPARKDADTRALEADLAAALGLDVVVDHTAKGAGVLTIRYLTLDQLDDLCRRLMGAGV